MASRSQEADVKSHTTRALANAALAACFLSSLAFAVQTVDGQVTNGATGAGLPNVAVRLLPAGDQAAYSTTTDAQGRFHLAAVEDGVYTVRYRAPGYWPVPGVVDGLGPAFPVAASGNPVHLTAKLQPIPPIAGHVRDAAGEPVPNATLWFLWDVHGCGPPACFPFFHQSKTGAKGEFTMGDPELAGTWLLSASPPSSWKPPEPRDGQPRGWTQSFYPGVSDPQLATRLIVETGADLTNLELRLAAVPVHGLRGRVLDPRGEPVPKAPVHLAKSFGPSLDQETGDDGAFEFPVVPDDEWQLSVEVEKGGAKLTASQPVRIKGRDLEGIGIRLTAPFAIHGKIDMDVPAGAAAPDPPIVMVVFNAGPAWGNNTPPPLFSGEPDENGNFTIPNLYPGPYQILPGKAPPGYYLDSIRLDGRDALGSDVPIQSDAQTITITYKLGGGTVRGAVEACGSGRVVLVPDDPLLRRGLFIKTANAQANGRFEIPAVRPGDYYAFCVTGESPLPAYAYLVDHVLRQAAKITVRANESTTAEIRAIRR